MAINIQNKYTAILSRYLFRISLILSLVLLCDLRIVTSQVNLNGVFQNYLAVQTTDDHEFLAAQNRFRVELDKPINFGGLKTELDLIHRFDQGEEIEFQLKEAYIEWFLRSYDLRIGHQKIIWGRANGSFITDIISPVDLREFLTISAEDIRLGLTSFNAIRYFGENSLQLVVSPFFQRDLLPDAGSRWFPARQFTTVFSPVPVTTEYPESNFSLGDLQAALRYNLLSPEIMDIDFFLMRWTHPTPAYDLSITTNMTSVFSIELIESYQNSWMTGVSTTIKIQPRLFLLGEALFVEKKLFTRIPFSNINDLGLSTGIEEFMDLFGFLDPNEGFLVTKPWIHSMAGVRTEIFETTLDAQFFVEGIFNYEDQIIQEEIYKYASILATKSFLRNRLQLLTLSRYNIDTEDFWVQLEGQYELNDNLQLTMGTNLFGGEKSSELSGHLSFSQFRQNSFIFSKIALYF